MDSIDAKAWNSFDKLDIEFVLEPRNVCLDFARDGFNPNRTINKKSSFILSMIIHGKKMPENKIIR